MRLQQLDNALSKRGATLTFREKQGLLSQPGSMDEVLENYLNPPQAPQLPALQLGGTYDPTPASTTGVSMPFVPTDMLQPLPQLEPWAGAQFRVPTPPKSSNQGELHESPSTKEKVGAFLNDLGTDFAYAPRTALTLSPPTIEEYRANRSGRMGDSEGNPTMNRVESAATGLTSAMEMAVGDKGIRAAVNKIAGPVGKANLYKDFQPGVVSRADDAVSAEVSKGMRTTSKALNATDEIAGEFIHGMTTTNPSNLFEVPVSTLSPERLKYLKEVNRLSSYADEVQAASNQRLIDKGDPSAATKKQLYEKYLQSSLTDDDLLQLAGKNKAGLEHELLIMKIADEPKIKKAIDPNFPAHSQNVVDDLSEEAVEQINRDLIERYGGSYMNLSRPRNIRPVAAARTSPVDYNNLYNRASSERYLDNLHQQFSEINLQRPVRNRSQLELSKADRGISNSLSKYRNASYNLGVDVKEAFTKSSRKTAPASEFVEGSSKKISTKPLLSALFKQGQTGKEVMQQVSKAKQAYIAAEKGHYNASSSLSSNSFPLYTTMLSNLKKSVPNTRYSIDGFSELNHSGYLDKIGSSTDDVAGFLNEHLSKLNLDGKKIPKVFVKDGQIMYPKISIEKYKLGGSMI